MNDTVPPSRAAILLVQLGTPDKPEVPEVRRYLREFLSDRRVVEQSPLIWWPILYSVVLTRRPKESAEKYRSIWTKAGSPLLVNTKLVAEALQDELNKRGRQVEVVWAMRYGNPSMADALRDLRDRGFSRIVVLPMYPQYSAATSGTVFDVIAREFLKWRSIPALRFLQSFHDDPGYIAAVAESIRHSWRQSEAGKPEKLIFSFHGLPQSCVDQGDPYVKQCQESAALIAAALGLAKEDWLVTFQSRFGRAEWVKPYTQPTVEALARKGVKTVDVVCPGFVSDCIETLERSTWRCTTPSWAPAASASATSIASTTLRCGSTPWPTSWATSWRGGRRWRRSRGGARGEGLSSG
jgi:ferrochelatase